MTYLFGEPAPTALLKQIAPKTVVDVPTQYLSVEEGFNVRDFTSAENEDHLANLTKLVAANGVEAPIWVRVLDERIVIIDGESRLRAAIEAKVETLPVLLDPAGDDEVKRTESLVVKNSGHVLSMLETVDVVKRLRSLGKTQTDISASLGFGLTHIRNLNLLDLATPKIKDFIKAGRVAPTAVVDLIREHKDEPQMVEEAIEAAVKRIERIEARGAAPTAEGKVTKKALDNTGVVYTRSTFDGLVRALQKIYGMMTPASDYRKFRNVIKNALENCNAPLEAEDEDPEA